MTPNRYPHATMHLQGLGDDVGYVWCAWGPAGHLFTALFHSSKTNKFYRVKPSPGYWRILVTCGMLLLHAALPCALAPPRLDAWLTRRSFVAALSSSTALLSAGALPAHAEEAFQTISGSSFDLQVPASYYCPKSSRPRVGPYDDTVFVAADYAAGRTAAVSRTPCASLLRDSGQPEALVGPLVDLKELGRPTALALMLARRRDGDPLGTLLQPRTEVLSADRDVNVLRFVLRELTYTATSVTQAQPSARIVQAHALFVPARESASGEPYLLTAWASSPSAAVLCTPTPCELEGGRLAFDCPAPRCETGGELSLDPTDMAIVTSLRLAL